MEVKTQALIAACKEAGYKHLTIFTEHENVPESKIHASGYGTFMQTGVRINTLVCAHPERLGPSDKKAGKKWPKIWGIIKDLSLNPHGAGYCDCYPVHKDLLGLLDKGYYEL
jgi:hypothetical protein